MFSIGGVLGAAAMSPLIFVPAALALLAMPGPTNLLLVASGQRDGFGRGLRLLPVVILAYALVLGLLRESWRPALLLFGWKAIAFAPMAFLPPYPHYYFFSEVGSCMLGGLVVARAVAQAGLAPVRPPGQAR